MNHENDVFGNHQRARYFRQPFLDGGQMGDDPSKKKILLASKSLVPRSGYSKTPW